MRFDVGEDVANAFEGDPGVFAGGTAVAAFQVGEESEGDTRRIELFAAPVLLLLLMIVFRTLIAAALPLLLAGLSILISFAVLSLLTEVTTIDLFALTTVTGLGIGLAIDYSLFVVARYRVESAEGVPFLSAQEATMRSAGRSVFFSALTVAAALAALVVFPQPFLRSTGIAGAITALSAGATALLVLPAVLAIIGPGVNRFAVRGSGSMAPGRGGIWRRLPAFACRYPYASLFGGGAVMLALASAALGMDLRTPDARALPPEASARQVADATMSFDALPATSLFLVSPDESAQPQRLRDELAGVDDVDDVTRPEPIESGFRVDVESSVDPLGDEGEDLVRAVRVEAPESWLVGGRAAEQVDQQDSVLDHAPWAIALVIAGNVLVIAAMTRSLIVPLLAVVVSLLSVAASLGVLVLVFETEWTANLLGTSVQDGIDISVPVIAFAVGFGLSTDYGIFLFARIREERASGLPLVDSIVEGVSSTGRLISASAMLLAVAVGAFVFSDLVLVKEFAVAIAVAVLLDATLVRGLLIPAALRIVHRPVA